VCAVWQRPKNPVHAPTEIRKADGSREPFDEAKLRQSLRRSGAPPEEEERVTAVVLEALHPGMSTKELYKLAFRELRRRAPDPVAARYGLARAVIELGPSGYPFERFVGAVLAAEGHRTKVGVTLQGRFVRHEIDVEAVAPDGRRHLCECKFRNHRQGKVDVRVALYVYARSLDLRTEENPYDDFLLVTNGRFTSDAYHYGQGVGLRMISWLYPEGDGLKARIDRAGVHPVTCLTHLRLRDKRELLRHDVVLCRELLAAPETLDRLQVSPSVARRTLKEAAAVVGDAS